ncbi:hypothetical protein HDU83_003844 [Entophlyctis luteolus]|nr:hypothetical protein HDU83_003844 [Entophlyctis luteolus]
MSVLLEASRITSLGDIVIDLYVEKAPVACTNFLKLCKAKKFNYALFHTVVAGFTAQTGGDCTGNRDAGSSVWGLTDSAQRYFKPEFVKKLKHNRKGVVSFACSTAAGSEDRVAASQFFFTLSDTGAEYLDGQHAVFGQVVEGDAVLDSLNELLVDTDMSVNPPNTHRPFRDIRINHTIILDDPFPDPQELKVPSRSPSPPPEMIAAARIGADEDVGGATADADREEEEKRAREQEAAARALTLEMIGDLPFAEIRPPENILFVCKLNPVTRDEDLELIFSRFGQIRSCEIIRDKKTQDSLCYAFIDFEEKECAEEAYLKMDNVLIDDRRIHVDFSQSVSKLHQDFLAGKRRHFNSNEIEEFGGKGLQRRRQYRDGDPQRRGDGHRDGSRDRYELVFDHEGSLEHERKRMRNSKFEKGHEDEPHRTSDDRDSGSGTRSGGQNESRGKGFSRNERDNGRARDDWNRGRNEERERERGGGNKDFDSRDRRRR